MCFFVKYRGDVVNVLFFLVVLVGIKVTVTKHVAVPQNQFQINPYGSLSQGMVPMTHRKVTDGLAKLRH